MDDSRSLSRVPGPDLWIPEASQELASGTPPDLPALRRDRGACSRQMSTVATRLALGQHAEAARVMAVVSPDRGDGRSFVAANMAALFAMSGRRTLLIDADFRHSSLESIITTAPSDQGLSGYLTGRTDKCEAQPVPGTRGLHFLAAGSSRTDGVQCLMGYRALSLLANLHGVFDNIVIDTPAAGSFADADAISAMAGSALLVARQNVSRIAHIRALRERLDAASARVVGALVNAA